MASYDYEFSKSLEQINNKLDMICEELCVMNLLKMAELDLTNNELNELRYELGR